MNPAFRQYLVNQVRLGIENIGPTYEAFGTRLCDYIANVEMLHRGLNASGQPVGGTVDSISTDGTVAAEYSAEATYFRGSFGKIFKDIRHAFDLHGGLKLLYLLSSQTCGPNANTTLTRLVRRIKAQFHVQIEIYDARRQAEFIVDHLLVNDIAVEKLAHYVATLDKLQTEFAATHVVPPLVTGYLPRPDIETSIKDDLQAQNVVALSGISGTGKSQIAVAIAIEMAKQGTEIIVWIPSSQLSNINELKGVLIERNGQRLNVLGLLANRDCLVILDDLQIAISADELRQYCGKFGRILVTRQRNLKGDRAIPFLNDLESRKLLEDGISEPCPNDVLELVKKTVGGHPLSLRLMNASVKNNSSWNELAEDCASIGTFPDEDKIQLLADRLLGRLERVLEKELSLFAWCLSARADRAFAKRVLGPVGLRKLDEMSLTAADRGDVLRVHDVVYAAMKNLNLPVATYEQEFERRMDEHIIDLAFTAGNALNFLNFCNLHRAKLEQMLASHAGHSTYVYCLAHTWSEQQVDLALLGDPAALTKQIISSGRVEDIDVSGVCEAIEVIYRKTKFDSGFDAAIRYLESCISIFDALIAAAGLSPGARRTALHHKAKTLRNLKHLEEAIGICETILAEDARPATKLLLARLLLNKTDRDSLLRSRDLLFEILEMAKANPALAEISVTLAAIETVGQRQLKEWFPEALVRFGDVVSKFIIESAVRGFDHAFQAFAKIGRALRYHDPRLFMLIFRELPRRRPEDDLEEKERAAWGDIYLSATEVPALGDPQNLAFQALRFYETLKKPDSFNLQQKGHALIVLNRFEEARQVIEPLVTNEPNPWNRYRLSQALVGLGRADAGLPLIDEALKDERADTFMATLLQQRWEIRKILGDAGAIDDLRQAHDVCVDEKHKEELAQKLAKEK